MPGPSDRKPRLGSRSTSFRSISAAFRSSLRSIRSRITGTCTKDDVDKEFGEGSSESLSKSSSAPRSLPPPSSKSPTDVKVSKGSKIWKKIRAMVRSHTRLKDQVVMQTDCSTIDGIQAGARPSVVLEDAVVEDGQNKRPDDWFYQSEIKESHAAKQRRLQLSQRLKAIREAECTFRPAITDYRKARMKPDFLQRQQEFEERRASLLHYQQTKQEWVLRDLTKAGHRHKIDPNGVWQRSVDWRDQCLYRRISRQIDRRMDDLNLCPFEPVRDWKRVRSAKMQQFRVWKNRVDQRRRSDFYRDLADVIESFSSEEIALESH